MVVKTPHLSLVSELFTLMIVKTVVPQISVPIEETQPRKTLAFKEKVE